MAQTFIALLRGINVGGHHKVPMALLRQEMERLGFENIITLLNSGNVIFKGAGGQEEKLEKKIAAHLEKAFGFAIPVLVRKAEAIIKLVKADPFKEVKVTDDIRLYVSFLKEPHGVSLNLPWIAEDQSFSIINVREKEICSVLDLSVTSTPKGMEALEKFYGKDITTRNWKTILRIAEKI
ncbi:MAG: DUF1697 domain-containing protein [Bacteroidia bacterium]